MENSSDKRKGRKMTWAKTAFLLLLVIGTIVIIRQQQPPAYRHSKGVVFGTTYSVTYQSKDDLQKDIETAMTEVDNSLSMFNDSSTISKVNRNAGMTPDSMFLHVFHLAMNVSRETGGAFDITVAPLVNAWGFGFKSGINPTQKDIDSLLAFIGYEKITYDESKGIIAKSDPRVMLDCSAIAKGYGSDHVADMFKRKGIANFMIEIGGEVVANGVNNKGTAWRIGIAKPDDDTLALKHDVQNVISVSGRAVATSGNYRNYYIKDNKKYAHTIDPASGRPVQHSLLSATVMADDCATADAYATAFMVMGVDKAKAVLEHHPELAAYLIYTGDGGGYDVWMSPEIKDAIIE